MNIRSFPTITGVFAAVAFIGLSLGHATAQSTTPSNYAIGTPPPGCVEGQMRCVTQQMRVDAAKRAKAAGKKRIKQGLDPLGFPDYFGVPNYANSPLPETVIDPATGLATSVLTPGIRKFVDSLPGIGAANHNNLGTYIPLAVPITSGRPGVPSDGDYYEIGLKDATHQFSSDLPASQVRIYRDMNPAAPDNNPHYLGPIIIARKDRPVRVKFTNELAPNSVLFLPVDPTLSGAGPVPQGATSENRATLHLHGGTNPWISDGIPHQWITPAGDPAAVHKGSSNHDVPDMWWDASGNSVAPGTTGAKNFLGDGMTTFYWGNQQGSRLQFYHDHAVGLTRLNVYAGEAAGYLITDPAEDAMIASGAIPGKNMPAVYKYGIPLIFEDKTFVPSSVPNANFPLAGGQLAAQDPTWDSTHWGPKGNLWFTHVYMPNQNPSDLEGVNAFGRWDYGPWFWPPQDPSTFVPAGQPIVGTGVNGCPLGTVCPGTPNPSNTPESYMDTITVNGTAYPYLNVTQQAYRFRLLNASNDRAISLSLFKADMSVTGLSPTNVVAPVATGTEVKMVGAVGPQYVGKTACVTGASATVDPVTQLPNNPAGCWPAIWPTDGRDGGVPDPAMAGPAIIEIGNEGGLLPAPVITPATPVNYNYNRRDIVVLNVASHGLFLMPAQRADILVDFSSYAPGTKIIMYNDAPAPVPAFDPRNDYYTGDPDQTTSGGAPTTLAGWGPNTRTVMQFVVTGPAANPAVLDLGVLGAALPVAYAATQPPPVVPEKEYDAAFKTTTAANTYARIQDTTLTFTPTGSVTPVTMPLAPKAIQELFTLDYGRMNATLGVEIPNTNFTVQTTIPYGYLDPITETIFDGQPTFWKITHNGVDTHPVHFHLFNVQVINRVGWDGAIRPPEPDEIGWKETVTMNPLEDIVVAFRPVSPANIPFAVPDSVRLLDPSSPVNSTGQFSGMDPNGNPITVTNVMTNFGWEYVWHCHILGHEENDFMRPVKFVGKATMISPVGGTTLPLTAVTFNWAGGAGVTSTYLWLGTTPGGNNLLNGTPGTATSKTVSFGSLPLGSTVYARLWSVINGTPMYNDYTYLMPLFGMLTPTPGSTVSGSSINFTWGAGNQPTAFYIWVGSTLGAYNLANVGPYAASARSASINLPANTPTGTLYVTLWATIGGVLQPMRYTYTYAAQTASTMISPATGSTITSPVTFSWNAGTGIARNYLWVGTTPGSSNLLNRGPYTGANSYSMNITGLSNGTTIYVRLVSQLASGVNLYSDYTYTLSVLAATITSPVNGATLTSPTTTFNWNAITGATNYYLWIGTTGVGSLNFANKGFAPGTTSYTTALPAGATGSNIYVRLTIKVGATTYATDYVYKHP